MTRMYEQLAPRPKKADGRGLKSAAKPALRVAFIGGRGVISKYSGVETYYEEIGQRLAEMGQTSPCTAAPISVQRRRAPRDAPGPLPPFARNIWKHWYTPSSAPSMRCLVIATSCTISAWGRRYFPSSPAGSERRRWSPSRDWTGSGESGAGSHPPFCNWGSVQPSAFPA